MLPDISEIKKRRKRLGITQKEIATMAGVSQSIIAKIESGNVTPSYNTVRKILDALDNLEKEEKIVAKDIMNTKIVYLKKDDKVEKGISVMNRSNYSQIPVLEKGYSVGIITEKTIFDLISNGKDLSTIVNKKIESVMDESLPTIQESESIDNVSALLKTNPAVLVTKGGKAIGILTKSDIFKIAEKG